MNLSLKDVGGSNLLVSQFTLAGNCSRGRRPSFDTAESPARAKELYDLSIKLSQSMGIPTASGVFAADMKIELLNDGPRDIYLKLKTQRISLHWDNNSPAQNIF